MRERLFAWLGANRTRVRLYLGPLIAVMVIGVVAFVHATGGIKFVYSHSMYLPIALAAIVYGVRGGVLVAIVGGVLLGPLTPIDTTTGEAQSTVNWLYRIGFFTLVAGLVGGASDAAAAYLARLHWHANHDRGTGLPNALALVTRLRQPPLPPQRETRSMWNAVRQEQDPQFVLAVLIDNLTEIEAAFGSTSVRRVVRQVADAIQGELQGEESVYRIGDDWIAAVATCADIGADPGPDLAASFSQRVRDASTGPYDVDELRVHADLYFGLAQPSAGARDPERWVQRASKAASTARDRSLRHVVVAGPDGDERAAHNLRLLGELQQALRTDQIRMHYQPKVVPAIGRVRGVEALMRWEHPARGDVPPGAFIPPAENSTLIDEVTYHAIDRSLRQLAAWDAGGLPQLSMAVNISTRNLADPRFADVVVDLLERHEVAGERLELEITESSFIDDMEGSITELKRLSHASIILSIDDFGTGYSSLRYLESMPVSTIKIDQVFMRSLPEDDGPRKIVDAAIGLAHSLDLQVVAEGVETRDAYDYLCDAGCDVAQGYFVARPLPAAEVEEVLRTTGGLLVPMQS